MTNAMRALAVWGDSITYAPISADTALITAMTNRGGQFWVPALTRQRVRTRTNLNFGVSGDTSTKASYRIGQVIDAKPDIVLVTIGTNDVSGAITAETFSIFKERFTYAVRAFLNAGIFVVATPPPPWTLSTAANRNTFLRMVDWVRQQQFVGYDNFMLVDPTVNFVDPLAADYSPKAGITYDGLHPKAQGAYYWYAPVANAILGLLPNFTDTVIATASDVYDATNNPQGNLISNGVLNGTTGTLTPNGATMTGQVADTFRTEVLVNGGTVTSLVATPSKVISSDGRPAQQIALSGTYVGGFDTQVTFRTLPTNFTDYKPGDMVYAEAEYEIDSQAAEQNISSIMCSLSITMGSAYAARDGLAGSVADQLPAAAHSAVLRTQPILITAQPTLISVGVHSNLRQQGATVLTAQSTYRIKGVALRKVAQ